METPDSVELPENVAKALDKRYNTLSTIEQDVEEAYIKFQEARTEMQRRREALKSYFDAIAFAYDVSSDAYAYSDGKLVAIEKTEDVSAETPELPVAFKSGGQTFYRGSDFGESSEYTAKEAIDIIRSNPIAKLAGFISPDEERKTVLNAWKKKIKP